MALLLVGCGAGTAARSGGGAASRPGAAAADASAGTSAVSAAASVQTTGGAGGKTAKVGASFSLTGADGPHGQAQRDAVLMAQDEINRSGMLAGWKLEIDAQDDAGDRTQAAGVFQKFFKDGAVAILGPTLSSSAFASDAEAVKAKVPVLGVSTTADGITAVGEYVFRDSLAEFQVAPNTIKVAKQKLNLKKAALAYASDDAFSKSGYDVFKKALADNGIEVTDTETFSVKDADFSTQLSKIKSAAPDAIVVSTVTSVGAGVVAQARKLGIPDAVRIIGGSGFNSPQVARLAGPAANGLVVGAAWIPSSPNPLSQKFVSDFKSRYNRDPDQFAAQAYAGMYILADAMKRANLSSDPSADREAIRVALNQTKNLPTVLGDFSFTPERDANHPPVVQQLQDGKFVLFS